jgi:transcriptional regulator with XRE-family HTH domain
MDLRARLGTSIRTLRLERNLSQEAFADLARIHRTYVSKVERGDVNISVDLIEKIAKTLEVPVSKLFKDAERLG